MAGHFSATRNDERICRLAAYAVQSGCLLGGSWVVISGVLSPLIWVIIIVTLLITPLITAHEAPSNYNRRPVLQGR